MSEHTVEISTKTIVVLNSVLAPVPALDTYLSVLEPEVRLRTHFKVEFLTAEKTV